MPWHEYAYEDVTSSFVDIKRATYLQADQESFQQVCRLFSPGCIRPLAEVEFFRVSADTRGETCVSADEEKTCALLLCRSFLLAVLWHAHGHCSHLEACVDLVVNKADMCRTHELCVI